MLITTLHTNYVLSICCFFSSFSIKVFNANTDGDTVKEILLGVTVTARVVRIWPLSNSDGYYAMRFEILGCVQHHISHEDIDKNLKTFYVIFSSSHFRIIIHQTKLMMDGPLGSGSSWLIIRVAITNVYLLRGRIIMVSFHNEIKAMVWIATLMITSG